jgi:hypothetical protein
MGSILETIKKGISALNPVGSKVAPVAPPKPVVVPKPIDTGYLGDSAKKSTKYNKAVEAVAEETK